MLRERNGTTSCDLILSNYIYVLELSAFITRGNVRMSHKPYMVLSNRQDIGCHTIETIHTNTNLVYYVLILVCIRAHLMTWLWIPALGFIICHPKSIQLPIGVDDLSEIHQRLSGLTDVFSPIRKSDTQWSCDRRNKTHEPNNVHVGWLAHIHWHIPGT
jgi:hypothetical protein